MLNLLLLLLVGWPAVLGSCILAGIGLFRRNYRLLVASAILAFPFSWYLSGFPIIRSPIFLLPLLPFSSAFAMRRDHEMIAWLIAVPFFMIVFLLFSVISAGNG
jgi:hypothetical protein